MRILMLYGALAALAAAAEFPEAEISNEVIQAKLYLPDAARGYYQGTRFDWSGVIPSLRFAGHEYFGKWFEKYDPKIHDAIMGPVEEFHSNGNSLGYDEAKPGGTFVRIGVGLVRKPVEAAYQRFKTYEIVDPGKWSVRKGKDWIEFTHRLKDRTGYAYIYRKTVRLVPGKPEMLIEHALKNTGRKVIETEQYNHNFFVMDNKPTGPDTTLRFPFEIRSAKEQRGPFQVRGREIVFPRELKPGESAFAELAGYGGTSSEYDIRVEHRDAGAGVRIVGDRPLSRLIFWSINTTACPEPYIQLRAEPEREERWTIRYEFYTLKP